MMGLPPPGGWGAWAKRSLLAGLAVVLPAVLTLYILWILFQVVGALFAGPLESMARYLFGGTPGGAATTLVGAALTLALLIGVGALAQRVGRSAFHRVEERIFRQVPVARGIHRAVRQLFDIFFSDGGTHRTVGLVEYPRPGMYALCFITSREPWRLHDGPGGRLLSVYIPTTPNPTSGYLILVPREAVTPLNMTVDEAARIIISGGSMPTPGGLLRASVAPDEPSGRAR